MVRHITPATSLESLQREAKRWLKALRARQPAARRRFEAVHPAAPAEPSLRDVQLAVAREYGAAGWAELKARVEAPPAMKRYHQVADALVAAYAAPDEGALRIVWEFFGHMRPWDGMRRYVRLALGKSEEPPPGDVITLAEARLIVARSQAFESWDALVAASAAATEKPLAAKAVRVYTPAADGEPLHSRDWDEIEQLLENDGFTGLDAAGQMTDALLERFTRFEHLTSLRLANSPALTDDGLRHLARLPRLSHLDLSSCPGITDRGLDVLRRLPALESIEMVWSPVTDAGMPHLASCPNLRRVNLMGSATGDGAIRALAGHANLRDFRSGNGVTRDGIVALREIPAYGSWLGGDVRMALCGFDAEPNYLLLRGPFGSEGLAEVARLEGLFALNVDAAALGLTGEALEPLVGMPHLGWLAFDAKDDAMPLIAAMPHLRFLLCQDTTAGDQGFEALGQSKSLEYIWGRRCHNLQRRGFVALSKMPALRGLSVSCLNVDDAGLAALPDFPSLVELMPMDVPDAGYRHVGRCEGLESLVLMYCRDTGDEATSHITNLKNLTSYFASYNRITDRTPDLLSGMASLERVVFDTCVGVSTAGVAKLARLPHLREVSVSGMPLVSGDVIRAFPAAVRVRYHV